MGATWNMLHPPASKKCFMSGENVEMLKQKTYKTCVHIPYISHQKKYLHGSIYGSDAVAIMRINICKWKGLGILTNQHTCSSIVWPK